MNKLPKVYENPINKKFDNTQDLFRSSINSKYNNKDINRIIDEILKSNDHIAKTRVRITLPNEYLVVDMIGKTNGSILTIDNRLIKINDIIDIEKY